MCLLCFFCLPFLQFFLFGLNKGFQFLFVLLRILQFSGNAAMILSDLTCLMAEFFLFTINLPIAVLNFAFFFFELFKIHLCSILFNILLTEFLLKIGDRIAEHISPATVFTY